MQKILFIMAPSCAYNSSANTLKEKNITVISQPLSLCYLAGFLRKHGYNIEIYDPHIENYDKSTENNLPDIIRTAIKNKIASTDYDVLGISSPFIYTYQWTHYIADTAKQTHPDKLVITGGGYPSLMPERVMEDRNIDYVVIGEGELALLALLDKINSAEKVDDLDGIAYRSNGNIFVNPKKIFIEEIEDIPYPAWDLVDTDKYFQFQNKKSLNIISSRACPYMCTFCSSYKSWGRGFRKRSAENILGEIDYLLQNFGINEVRFIDDNMTVDKKRFMKIAEGLRDRGIHWNINNISSFTTDNEMLRMMKDGGCDTIAIGVESASKKTLKSLQKPVDLVRTKEILKECRRIGLRCNLLFIAGLPYDTKDDMNKTLKYAEEARADWCTLAMLIPFPGTDIYDFCVEHDYFIEKDIDLAKFTLRNKGFIETEHWDRDWMIKTAHEANIRINFIRNYNILEKDGDLDYAIKMFGHVFRFHPKHVISCICLAYAYFKKGDRDKAAELICNAQSLLELEDVKQDYEEFMNWDEEVINFYHSQIDKNRFCQAGKENSALK
ncbi:MAG: B12-binding domain-containing radical SAM protein [Sedimentisphaerales bacterium]|nr:B12-binding domain-containing radical SAM protein [Sedimentisphaerales bacterium]